MSSRSAAPGHVFVLKGDLRRLVCDAYLVSSDKALRPGGKWEQIENASARMDLDERRAYQSEKTFALPVRPANAERSEATPILTAVPYSGVKDADQLRERVRHFFRHAVAEIDRRRVTQTRARPLVAIPLFGVDRGGGGPVRGAVLRVLYEEARAAAAAHGYDVALVVRDPRSYDLAQAIRRDVGDAWNDLDQDKLDTARVLGSEAAARKLVPFMGSGVSVSAGAPDWRGLIRALADEAGLDDEVADTLAQSHDVLDQAEYLRREFAEVHARNDNAFAEAIIKQVDLSRYGLAPALLASLEAEQSITLNYDNLFEMAAEDAGLPRRVIPGGHSSAGDRWLLKLHGSVDDPASIVLTRDHYLGYDSDRAALSSLAKATLMTRRLLFVGFGMSDSHFHEIAHDVRRALPRTGGRATSFGTVLTLSDDPVTRRLWKDDLDFISFDAGDDRPSQARRIEIFLDALLAHACDGHSYVLARGYASTLPASDAVLRDNVERMLDMLDPSAHASPAWPILRSALEELGWDPTSPLRRRTGHGG